MDQAVAPGESSQGQDSPVLDLLVVGGGPGGTATAFRAKELGLTTLVLDYDDLMKRIRDYSKDKFILPDFGGGDRMCFPKGEDLIAALCFSPIDKDDLHQGWKKLYQEHNVESRTAVELTNIHQDQDGLHCIETWDHKNRCDLTFRARHVAIAIGRGVPRRFNIPGDTDGIALRLDNPAPYVGRPTCVVGGGTSAAEAVIALSKAKAEAKDSSPVFWSYRGDRLPRVSKALAEVFFEAYLGNGNIRYCPLSEPAAVITADDQAEYLSIRVDRRWIEGRPNETTHLEFPKECCIACIGEDMPETLLATLGAPLVEGGPKQRKRIVVNRYLESRVRNLYLVGDLLSQAYFETENFDAEPASFREVKHPGNIKAALRDGVLVAQVVRQRIDGKSEVSIEVADGEQPKSMTLSSPLPAPVAPSAALDDPVPSAPSASLVQLFSGDGGGDEFPLGNEAEITIGRKNCDINCPEDVAMSVNHASVSATPEGFILRDKDSSTGVFLELASAKKRTVVNDDLIRCGRQFLQIRGRGDQFSLVHFDQHGKEVGRHTLPEGTIVLGRKNSDVVLDASDRTLSRRHLSISRRGAEIQVKDLKSANGTLLRVREGVSLVHGDRFRVGQQTFALNLEGAAANLLTKEAQDTASFAVSTEILAATQAGKPEPSTTGGETGDGPSVTFKGTGKCITVQPGQTLCEAAEAAGITINAECHAGVCGSDPIRILSGHEHLAGEVGEQEQETLEDLCNLEPGPCRLACMARVTGPVEVELL